MDVAPDQQSSYLRYWRSRRDFFAGVVALGCGVAAVVGFIVVIDPLGGSSSSSSKYDRPCHDQRGAPLKARDLIAAFEPEGVTMFSLPESMYCDPSMGSGQVADVSNQRSVVTDADAVARDGWITCRVLEWTRRASGASLSYELDRGPDSPIFSGTKSWFDVGNVHCALYPGNDEARQTAQVLRAMRRLDAIRAHRTAS